MHVGARWLIKLDLHGFFDSVRERSVFPIFVELGYPRLVALELTRLCTRVKAPHPVQRRLDRQQVAPPYWVTFEGQLPQGAPTSGMLANAIMRRADEALSDLAQAQGLVYTRYSDDIVLSAGPGYSRRRAASAVTRASAILRANGFSVHRAKTRIVPPGSRQVILGLLVDHDQVRLLPTYKRRIEVHIRGVARFGLVEHAQHRGFESVLSMINHIDGCIAFAQSVEPAFADTVRDRWAATLASIGYLRTATS